MTVLTLSPAGRGEGEGARRLRLISGAEPPHPVLLPHSASKTRVNALMGEKGRGGALGLLLKPIFSFHLLKGEE
jgi:hypothetical protein